MIPGNYDLHEYYNTPQGEFVFECLKSRIQKLWPLEDMKGKTIAGFGYSFPYLEDYQKQSGTQSFGLIAMRSGPYHWPEAGDNRVVLCRRGEWPFPNESMDHILVIHDGEYVSGLQAFLAEVWRVLKPNGRLLMVLPNRKGKWSRSDNNPFGHGAPYSVSQFRDVLRENHFVYEGAQGALLTPPMRSKAMLKLMSLMCEPLSAYCPAMSGVFLVEARKRLYALPPGTKILSENIRKLVWPSPDTVKPATS